MPSGSRASTRAAASPGTRIAISLKNRGVRISTPGTAASASRISRARLWLRAASWRKPVSPSSDRWMVKASARGVGGLGDLGRVGGDAEDVGGLDDAAGGLVVDGVDHRGLGVDGGLEAHDGHALGVGDGLGGGRVVGVEAAGEDALFPAVD